MTDTPLLAAFQPPSIGVLIRARWLELVNRIRQTREESPIKLAASIIFVLLIWVSLFVFFSQVLDKIYHTSLEGVVAIPMVFRFFFIALMVMLTFSNAILAHGSLFAWPESAYLFSSPLRPAHVVAVKLLEGLILSSWSLILLGIPLMLAMASRSDGWLFYPYFIGFFLSFVPIPAAVGVFIAWAVAMWFPKGGRRLLIALAVLFAALSLTWMWQVWSSTTNSFGSWIKNFYSQMSLLENAVWPSTWVSRGIYAAANRQLGDANFYLYLTFANALFFAYFTVELVGARVLQAYSRAQAGAGGATSVRGSRLTRTLTFVLFPYLPRSLRLITLKDLRTFLRDPLQWSQLAILFGLLTIYIINIPQINGFNGFLTNRMLVSYLNFAAVCLILATFTSRFVYPMISLEGYQLWLIGLLPLRRGELVLSKFAFALTVSLVCAVGVMGLSSYMLQLPWTWALLHTCIMSSVCVGLSGLAVGIGARLPLFEQRNPTRIASGFGGTINLILSVVYIILVLVGVGLVAFRLPADHPESLDPLAWAVLFVVALAGPAIAAICLTAGSRHFARVEM